METKLCKKCNLEKDINCFRLKKDKTGKYYIYSYCKMCEKEWLNIKRKKYDKKYRETHKEEIKRKSKERKKELSLEQKEKIKMCIKKWRNEHKDKLKEYYNKDNKKRQENPFLHFKDQIRHEIFRSFKTKGKIKNEHTEKIAGMKLDELYSYLKQTFKNNYKYEWDEKEKVHIDHIIPLSSAKSEN